MLALDRMDSAETGRYLEARGALTADAPVTVEPLGGGVSNIVLRVTTPTQCLVLKQALPELRVEAYWPSRVDRALREAEALRIAAERLPRGTVPDVHFIDEENFIYGMACAPAGATLWKDDLLGGTVEIPVAAAAGRLLARLHAIQEPAVRNRFIDDEVFWQLRIDPYYNTTAEAHPSLKPVFRRAIARMKARKTALVHGDYSPKNIFVLHEEMGARVHGKAGGSARSILLLDFEVVHWGDPAFDLAFCVNHLLIKSIVNAHVRPAYFQAVTALLEGYRDALPGVNWTELEAETRLQLGCLMLARIDGKSPVEYITDEPTKETVRRVSRFILQEEPATVDDVFARIAGETAP